MRLNLGSRSNIPFAIPHDLSSRENCQTHLRQKSRATVPRPLSSSFGDVPVQAGPQRQVVHLALHAILQFFGEACNLAVVEHPDLRGQKFDDLRTSEVRRHSILSGSLPRILSQKNRSSWHHLSTDAGNIVNFSDTATYKKTPSKNFTRFQHRPCMCTLCRRADPSKYAGTPHLPAPPFLSDPVPPRPACLRPKKMLQECTVSTFHAYTGSSMVLGQLPPQAEFFQQLLWIVCTHMGKRAHSPAPTNCVAGLPERPSDTSSMRIT